MRVQSALIRAFSSLNSLPFANWSELGNLHSFPAPLGPLNLRLPTSRQTECCNMYGSISMANDQMKKLVTKAITKIAGPAFFCAASLLGSTAHAECKFMNGNTINGAIPSTQHCSRGYLVPNDQDFCLRGPLSNHQPKVPGSVGGMTLSADKYGKPYTIGKAKCIPGGLIVISGWNWCELDPANKVVGEVIREGQACKGTIVQPLPISN